MDNERLMRRFDRAAIDYVTLNAGGGALVPEQVKAFWEKAMDVSVLLSKVDRSGTTALAGTIPTISVAGRQTRKQIEGTDLGNYAVPTFGNVAYSCVGVQLPWAINGKAKRQAVNDGNFEQMLINIFTETAGLDAEDLCINGDESSADPFIQINDGLLVQMVAQVPAAQRLNGALTNAGKLCEEHFSLLDEALPSAYERYQNQLVYIMSPTQAKKWVKACQERNDAAGTAALLGDARIKSPHGIPILAVPKWSNSRIALTWPGNFVFKYTFDMMFRSTDQGKEAIFKDQTYYTLTSEFDIVIKEPQGIVDMYGMA